VESTSAGVQRAGLYKAGAGELGLSGNNSFNGSVEVSEGTLLVGSPGALGSTFDGAVVSGGASLVLINGITVAGEGLLLNSTSPAALDNRAGNNTWSGPMLLQRNSSIRVSPDWVLTTSGVISGPGTLTKVGGGVLWLAGSANNTYAGMNGYTYMHEGSWNSIRPPLSRRCPGTWSSAGLRAAAWLQCTTEPGPGLGPHHHQCRRHPGPAQL